MRSYPKILASVIAAVGALLFIFNLSLGRANSGIPYLLNIIVTVMVHNTTIMAIVQEYRGQLFAWREGGVVRKGYLLLLMMFAIYSIITFVVVQIKFG
jgi:hypothetical protein